MTVAEETLAVLEGLPAAERGDEFLFPYVLVRRTSVPSSALDRLVFSRTRGLLDRYFDLRQSSTMQAPAICAILERTIGKLPPSDLRNGLIALKRDVYNDRAPEEKSLELVDRLASLASPAEEDSIRQWIRDRQARDEFLSAARNWFDQELVQGRSRLRKMFRKREFRRGLAAASSSLSYELKAYLESGEGEIRRLRQIERSLIRYYSRCAMKLSPFSTFLRTSLVKVSSDKPAARSTRTQHVFKVNRAFIGELVFRIQSDPEFKHLTSLTLNTSITVTNEAVVLLNSQYMASGPARFRLPAEAITTLPKTALLHWLVEEMRQHSQPVTRHSLCELMEQQFGCSRQKAEELVHELVRVGVLVADFPLPSTGRGEIDAVCRLLEGSSSPRAEQIRNSLRQVDRLVNELPCAREQQQKQYLLAQAEEEAQRAFTLLTARDESWKGLLVFEDCVEEPVQKSPISQEYRGALNDCVDFASSLGILLDDNVCHGRTLCELLVRHFGGGPVTVLEFISFCGDFIFNQQAKSPGNGHASLNPLGLPELDQFLDLRRELTEVISSASDTAELDIREIGMEKGWFHRLPDFPSAVKSRFLSCYCQPVIEEDGGVSVLLGSIHRGPARPLLRFLSSLSDRESRGEVLRDLQQWIQVHSGETEICELAATFDFNVNLHPPVFPRSVQYPGERHGDGRGALCFSDLLVKLDQDGQACLVHGKSGRRIALADLGMMADLFQPFAYRLLLMLSGAPAFSPFIFNPYWWNATGRGESPVDSFPRLRFGRSILRRRAWSICKDMLPKRRREQDDMAYFVAVQEWQRRMNLPDQAFVREAEARKLMTELERQPDRKNWLKHKPEYLHFGNYFLLQVFEKAIQDVQRLYIEEVLPAQDSWRRTGTARPLEFVMDLRCDATRMSTRAQNGTREAYAGGVQ
jgi:hypothetical protein